MCNNRGRRGFRRVNVKTSAGFLEDFHCLENILFAFFAKPGDVPEFSLFRDSLHIGDRAGFKVRPQEGDFLRAKRLELQQIQNGRRIFLEEFFAQRIIAGLNDFLQMLDHAVADSRKLFKFSWLLDELLNGFRQAVDQFGGLLVAAVSADDGAINFQELRGFAKYAGDLFVVHDEEIISPDRGSYGVAVAGRLSSGEVAAARQTGARKTSTAAPQNAQIEPHYHRKGPAQFAVDTIGAAGIGFRAKLR